VDINENANKVVWWLIGIMGTVSVSGLFIITSKIDALGTRIGSMEVQIAAQTVKTAQIDALVNTTRSEQVGRISQISDMATKLNGIEISFKFMTEKMGVLADELDKRKHQ
jgi:VanZ family protein